MGLFDLLKKRTKNDHNTKNPDTKRPDTAVSKPSTGSLNQRLKQYDEHIEYQKKANAIYTKYFAQTSKIEAIWSQIYNSKDYHGELSEELIVLCNENKELYKELNSLDIARGMQPVTSSPSYTRLSMLYEKREEYAKAIEICKEAIANWAFERNDGMQKRLNRILKKANLNPEETFQTQSEKPAVLPNSNTNALPSNDAINRKNIDAEIIDAAQQQPASQKYIDYIQNKYYPDFPEKPFVSKDRELYTNWEEQIGMFPQSILSKEKMTRFDDGLLPGHVYMLYWIKFIHRKRIPVFFEYEFGICFSEEKNFLENQGYVQGDTVLDKGIHAIVEHQSVILEKANSYKAKERIATLSKTVSNLE